MVGCTSNASKESATLQPRRRQFALINFECWHYAAIRIRAFDLEGTSQCPQERPPLVSWRPSLVERPLPWEPHHWLGRGPASALCAGAERSAPGRQREWTSAGFLRKGRGRFLVRRSRGGLCKLNDFQEDFFDLFCIIVCYIPLSMPPSSYPYHPHHPHHSSTLQSA